MTAIDWPLTIAAVLGAVVGYVVVASFTYALVPADWRDDNGGDTALMASLLWPFLFAVLALYRPAIALATIGPRVVSWHRRPRLPKAQVRR